MHTHKIMKFKKIEKGNKRVFSVESLQVLFCFTSRRRGTQQRRLW